jgi:eukaryotic-like serine/threonine-protein kinase
MSDAREPNRTAAPDPSASGEKPFPATSPPHSSPSAAAPASDETLPEKRPTPPKLAGAPGAALGPGAPRLAGRFELLDVLGRGGMGIVYRARDPLLGRELAVKVLHEQFRGDERLRRRLLEEAQVGGQLQHPGVVPVYDAGELPDGRPYLAMRLVKGRTLAGLLAERPDVAHDRPRFLTVFQQVCEAVGYAHSKGVLHRDLKPGNVMVGPFGQALVMDWGLTKVRGHADEGEEPNAPPVSNVVETVRSADAGSGTQAGSVLGTCAYMAPEQARGEADRVGERADVFGLGAILSVILTGQPPYRGPTNDQVYLLARRGELADAHQRLDRCGADAELVALARACLAPEQDDRPRDAGAVAAAVAAYQAGVQERLRRAELDRTAAEVRVKEERKRRKLAVLLTAALVGLLALGGGGGWWLHQQQAEARRAVESSLGQARDLQQQYRFAEAKSVLTQAAGQLGGWRRQGLRRQVEQALADLDLTERLDRIRLGRSDLTRGRMDNRRARQEYPEAFHETGLDVPGEDPSAVAARTRESAISGPLVAALDDWALATDDARLRARLFQVARAADPDSWRDQVRDRATWEDRQALQRLAAEAPPARPSLQLLTVIGQRLQQLGADPEPLLRSQQRRFPADFWINYELGSLLWEKKRPAEAEGFLRAAVALRPQTSAAHTHLGNALVKKGDRDGAIDSFRQALACDPTNARAHNNLGLALWDKGERDQALACYQEALAIDPEYAGAHFNLGLARSDQGKPDEALACYRQAVRFDPTLAEAHNNLGAALLKKGEVEGATACFQKALQINPGDALAHFNLGYALHAGGKLKEAIACYRQAIDLEPKDAHAHWNLGNALRAVGELEEAVACWQKAIEIDPRHADAHIDLALALARKGRLDEAVAYYQRALAIDPKLARAHYNLGNALTAQGKPDEAVECFRQALAIDPTHPEAHCNLGHLLRQQGKFAAALASLKRGHELGSKREDWRYPSAQWVRACEQLLRLDEKLPAVLEGRSKPADAAEKLAFADLCRQYKQRYAAAARLYADAFAEQPKLADDQDNGHRYHAACAAALAGCGQGEDAAGLSEKESARLRRQALGWLRADLAARAAVPDRNALAQVLRPWQSAPALAGVRDSEGLAKLPDAERKEWEQFWADISARIKTGTAKE